MTVQQFYKRGTITAEQFDGSVEMATRYGIQENAVGVYPGADGMPNEQDEIQIETLEGWLDIHPGDWIATGVNGEHWPIADDIFRKTYEPLPAIPEAVVEYIEACQLGETDMGEQVSVIEAFDGAKYGDQSNHNVVDWIEANGDAFARAWLMWPDVRIEEDKHEV